MNPLVYGLCEQSVTVYHKTGEGILRQEAEKCYFSASVSMPTESYGKSMEKKFLLIIPAGDIQPQPGDRIYAGIGPEEVDWERFLPALVPEVYEISYVSACCWDEKVVHWEAGHKKEAL